MQKIDRTLIRDYFDLEADVAREKWEALMALTIKDRIRKRRAIEGVYLDQDFEDESESGYILRRITFRVNLSDFKEGEPLLLHQSDSIEGIECTLIRFDGDNSAIVEVFPPNMPTDVAAYYGISLILDKNCVDLRSSVYYNFLNDAPPEDSFWDNLIINTRVSPVFENETENEAELEDTVKNFGLSLLPRQKEAVIRSMSSTNYYLIQGPPGTGKSFVLGLVILEELLYFRHKVAIVGPNHMAINNALETVLRLIPTFDLMLKIGQSFNAPTGKVASEGRIYVISNLQYLNVDGANSLDPPILYGLTPHSLYTRRARDLEFDVLIIDEAGQMTIPLALMGMVKVKKVIFAGDHKQLPPIIPETIEGSLSVSVFESLLKDDNCTMLDTSFRMCETICDFVSDMFYDGKLKPIKSGCSDKLLCDSPLYSFDNPLVFLDVEDSGEQTSDKEAEFIIDTITGFLDRGIDPQDIAVLAPFRAQAASIRRRIGKIESIPEEKRALIVSDTVDKLQGQEREIIFFSLTAGAQDYVVEMADFLIKPNRLNVAFSRAKSKLIIVGNFAQLRSLDIDKYPHIPLFLEYAEKYAL